MRNSLAKGTKLVCDVCQAKGCHAFDLERYTCHAYRDIFGAGKFPEKRIRSFKKGVQLQLMYLQCLDTTCQQGVRHLARWDSCLTRNTRGRSACKQVFLEDHWSENVICQHRSKRHDSVCQDRTKRGYKAGRFGSYECDECMDWLARTRFERHIFSPRKARGKNVDGKPSVQE